MKKEDLRIVYMGTPDFAVESLKRLVDGGYNVVGVVTMPDKPAGRGHKIQYSPIKQYALEQDLPLLQPEKLKNEEFLQALSDWKADLQIVVAFRMPIGILGSLVVCTILYVLFSFVMTGLANYKEFINDAKPVATAIAHTPYTWLQDGITVAILAGYTSVILVMLLGQSRVFYSMSHDGLLPRIFSHAYN